MKKLIITSVLGLSFLALNAQVEVTTKSFDLESQNKHKNWRVGEAGIDSKTGNVFVNMLQPYCDATVSYDEITTRGLGWNIDKLVFDNGFNFVEAKPMKYKSTEEAILNGENVYGKKYNAILGSGIAGSALNGVAMPKGAIDNSYMFTNIVTGTSGMTGFKVATSYIGLQIGLQNTKTRGVVCSENPAVFKLKSEDAKEEKGQRWIPMYNNPVPNGGNVLFNTVGVIKEEKQHYVFRKYDKNANIIKEQTFTFSYQCILNGKEIEKAPGEFDYIFIATPINYKKSKMSLAPANSYQYFYVDGNTYEIKENITIVAPNSEWLVNHVMRDKGAIYLVGTCGEKSTVYADIFSVPKPESYENIQVAKIENGKLVYAKSTMNKDFKPAMKTIEGLKSSSKINFCMPFASLYVKNGKLIYSGQQEYGGIKGALQTIVFDGNGKVEATLSKQEKTIARSHLSFSKDGKKFFWLLENVEKYNDINNIFTLTPKKAREVITSLSVLTYDLEANNILKFQNLENDEWAVNYKNPILMDNENIILMLGNKITKKAREGEIVFITINK
jgi:hypothetical protein